MENARIQILRCDIPLNMTLHADMMQCRILTHTHISYIYIICICICICICIYIYIYISMHMSYLIVFDVYLSFAQRIYLGMFGVSELFKLYMRHETLTTLAAT